VALGPGRSDAAVNRLHNLKEAVFLMFYLFILLIEGTTNSIAVFPEGAQCPRHDRLLFYLQERAQSFGFG
jgi:hypothetical protein